MQKYTRDGWRRCKNTLETSGKDVKKGLIEYADPHDCENLRKILHGKKMDGCSKRMKVNSHLLHSFRVYFHIFSTRFECNFTSSQLFSSVVFRSRTILNMRVTLSQGRFAPTLPVKIHSKGVEKMQKYTQNEWRRCKTTLETSGEDVKSHSFRV